MKNLINNLLNVLVVAGGIAFIIGVSIALSHMFA